MAESIYAQANIFHVTQMIRDCIETWQAYPHYVASVQAACRPASKLSSRVLLASRSRKGALRTTHTPRASLQDVGMLLAAAAEEAVEAVKPGSVEAPTGRIGL